MTAKLVLYDHLRHCFPASQMRFLVFFPLSHLKNEWLRAEYYHRKLANSYLLQLVTKLELSWWLRQ